MASVQIRDVHKSFGAADVIHGVSVDIAHGEFVILVGPSGCGKSTLLRMIAGLESITGGEIAIADRVVNGLEPKERDIAMVFQNYALYPQMSVAQNMGFSLELKGTRKDEIKRKVDEVAAVLGLEPLLARKPSQLSGGQRQRVAMGRAIVRKPRVFLFDEPLSNLDAKLRVQMRSEIKALHQRLGSTIIYVTHDQIEAMTMADKIVVLQAGHIEQVGTPLELYDKPVNMFVAGFLGSPAMNFIKGTAINDGGPGLRLASGKMIRLSRIPDGFEGRPIIFGVRPETITIGTNDALSVKISLIEPTGSETYLNASLDGQEIVCVFRDRIAHRVGEEIALSFAADEVHFFDPGTQARIG